MEIEKIILITEQAKLKRELKRDMRVLKNSFKQIKRAKKLIKKTAKKGGIFVDIESGRGYSNGVFVAGYFKKLGFDCRLLEWENLSYSLFIKWVK